MDVAIFGGSFDPPHIAHEQIIKKAVQKLGIDTLFVVPTYLNPFKSSFFVPAKKRLEWVKKLLTSYEKAEVLEFEVEQKRAVSTIETIKYILEKYDINKIYLIIGADNLASLPKWKDFERLKKIVTFVVATRDAIEIPTGFIKLDIDLEISSTTLRERLDERFLPIKIKDDIIEYYNKGKRDLIIDKIVKILDDKKAENIEVFDMRGKDYIVDDVIIASTLNEKHGYSLTDHLKKELKSEGVLDVEQSNEWSIIDLGDKLIHLMSPESRAKYNLEEFLSKREKSEH